MDQYTTCPSQGAVSSFFPAVDCRGGGAQSRLLKLEKDKNQLSKGLDPWSNHTATTSTLHYLLQEKERAQMQEQLQIYHQQGFSYLHHHQRRQQPRGAADGGSSGESTPVAVEAALATAFGSGRIVRSSAGRKDRHSKVCTARGLRDRRVRLAAHTAIRFYDVQDRLGYDRPSKAVDWLMRNAKAAIEELPDRPEVPPAVEPPEAAEQPEQVTSTSYGFGGNPTGVMTNSFLQHSLGADQVPDNVKSLFPSSSTATAAHDEYRGSPPDLLSRTTCRQAPQELCLTLQSNQNHIFSHVSPNHHGVISSAGVPGWPDHGQRMLSWHASENGSGETRGSGNGDSYMFGIPPRQGLDQSHLFSHGEPLQSSGGWAASAARAWLDPLAAIHQPSPMSGQLGFSHLVGGGGGGGGFMGFLAPAAQRLQGEEEQGSEVMRGD